MENIKQSANGLGGVIAGFAILVFLLLGISGTLYKLLAPGGWIMQLFGRGTSHGFAMLFAFALLAAVAWLTRHYGSTRSGNRFADLIVYGFTAAGLFYATRFWLTGAF